MLPTRAWELLCGALLAYTGWTPQKQKNKIFCFSCGLALMLTAILGYNDVVYPGWWALFPCLGAVLYIAGAAHLQSTFADVLIKNKRLVFIGVISYSLYLWHWPVFVFYSTFPFYKEINFINASILIPLIFFISYLSWRFVEKPVRQQPFFKKRKVLWVLTICCMGSVFSMASYMRYSKTYVSYTYTKQSFTAFPKNISSPDKIPVDFIFIGDSHCEANEGIFQKLAEKYQLTGLKNNQEMKNALWQHDTYRKIQKNIEKWNSLTEYYRQYTCKNLFITFRYLYKLSGKERYYSQDKERLLSYLPNKNMPPEQGFLQSMRDMFDEAYANGIEYIYIQYPVPEPKDNIPCKANAVHVFLDYSAEQINKKLGETAEEYQKRNKKIFALFAELKKEYPQIEFVDITPYLLNKTTQQYAVMNEKNLFYYDDDHLSFEGTMQYYDAYDKIFAKIAEEKQINNKKQ